MVIIHRKYYSYRNTSRGSDAQDHAVLLSRRRSGVCGLSTLNGSADSRPLQPEAFGSVMDLPG